LREELARRLGRYRCWIFQYPENTKDANEILMGAGPKGLKLMYQKHLKEYPLEGITYVEQVSDQISDIYQHGWPEGIGQGYENFDQHCRIIPGQFTTVTGIPGSGKSQFVDQWAYNISKKHEWRWGIFSPESAPIEYHAIGLIEKHISKPLRGEGSMSVDELQQGEDYIGEHFYWVNFDIENLSLKGILSKFEELVVRKGITGCIIDPWNQLEHQIPKNQTETQYISEALSLIGNFCRRHSVHVFLIAHPVKLRKVDGKYEIPTLYSINGSSNFFNKTYNGVTVYRDFETNQVEVYVQKVKFKWLGKLGKVEFEYDVKTGCYREPGTYMKNLGIA
jgi:twinkle protein